MAAAICGYIFYDKIFNEALDTMGKGSKLTAKFHQKSFWRKSKVLPVVKNISDAYDF